ncbi:TPA: restriction endonuclease subunit S [Enterococcus faecalis]|uniref:restriction endonuclease subunit S n=1 Tax=Enterococcus faecalis TaxID=1351 RepID=UPI003B23CC28|nr:restriction endonuclease subunit S [Enterococcus faecalis]
MNNKEFLNEIPESWGKIKLKNLVSLKITDGPHETPDLIDEGIPFISAEAIKNNTIDFTKKRGFISEELHKKYSLKCSPRKNDILIIKSGATTGNSSIVETDEIFDIWSPLALVRANTEVIYPKFLFDVINSTLFKNQIEISWSFGTQQNIGMRVIENLFVPVPEKNIQKIIYKYIHLKIEEINSLIGVKEKQIKLLEEQRQAMITEAVTKGLNPNVKMKDSGVDWIGEIPEHWDVTKIKYTTYVKGRIGWQGLRSDEFIDEGPSLVTGTDFKNGKIDWQTCYHVSEERYKEAVPIQLKEDDLLITKDGTIGKLALVKEMPERAILNSGIFVTRPLMNQYINSYLYWNLTSAPFSQYIRTMETGSTIKHLYQETFVNYSYALPPKYEQESISYYLNNETQKLETIKQSMLNQISKLKEYRQSLIHEAVTGKIPIEEMESYLKEVEKNGG